MDRNPGRTVQPFGRVCLSGRYIIPTQLFLDRYLWAFGPGKQSKVKSGGGEDWVSNSHVAHSGRPHAKLAKPLKKTTTAKVANPKANLRGMTRMDARHLLSSRPCIRRGGFFAEDGATHANFSLRSEGVRDKKKVSPTNHLPGCVDSQKPLRRQRSCTCFACFPFVGTNLCYDL